MIKEGYEIYSHWGEKISRFLLKSAQHNRFDPFGRFIHYRICVMLIPDEKKSREEPIQELAELRANPALLKSNKYFYFYNYKYLLFQILKSN